MVLDADKQQKFWDTFIRNHSLSKLQVDLFKTYLDELLKWNETANLTRITSVRSILNDHFSDSLQVGKVVEFKEGDTVCDIGSGAGFPGIPLKIMYPSLRVILIEVNRKKINFLIHVIELLGLEGIEVYPLDWRTFLRKTDDKVDYFLTRAAIDFKELLRVFKPSSPYNQSTLIYWASQQWQMGEEAKPFFVKEEPYKVGSKNRRLIFFTKER